ncbi:MAG: hypothetical protein ACK56F_26770, partial [bacterium]
MRPPKASSPDCRHAWLAAPRANCELRPAVACTDASAKAPGSSPNHAFPTVFSGVWTGADGAGGTGSGSVD